jgi:hypothetical protein
VAVANWEFTAATAGIKGARFFVDVIKMSLGGKTFMDHQVELWMEQLVLDDQLEVPHSVLRYFFQKSCEPKAVKKSGRMSTGGNLRDDVI